MDGLKVKDQATATVNRRGPRAKDELPLVGKFKLEHWRNGVKIDEFEVKNTIVNEGKNSLLDIMFHAVTQITTWSVGLIDNASFSAIVAADVMSSHSGWIENVDYDEAARVAWTEGAASGQAITNASPLVFTMNATKTIKGIFLVSNSTKSGTTGVLWAATAFASTVNVIDNDELKITYSVNC